jgi:hypothetical protein
VKFRGVNIHNNGGTAIDYYGVNIAGQAGSSYDLGTLADPGLNTFLGNGVSGAALTIQSPAGITVAAIGNVWAPNLQGADPTGKYAPVGNNKLLEVLGPVNTAGPVNYHLATTSALDLAAVP